MRVLSLNENIYKTKISRFAPDIFVDKARCEWPFNKSSLSPVEWLSGIGRDQEEVLTKCQIRLVTGKAIAPVTRPNP